MVKKVFGIVTLVMLAAFLILPSAQASEIGLLKHIDVNGEDYVENTQATLLLLLGIDSPLVSTGGVRQGGQADFILLVVIDHDAKVIRQLQIDRDTMLDIPTVNVFGLRNGTRFAQLCLAHGMYGGEEGCEFTAEAVSELLLGTKIDLYVSVGMDSIGVINDELGGVTVTLPEDYTALDPAMKKDVRMTLTAQQAEYLVRGRTNVGDQTNASRMVRQRVFMEAAAESLKKELDADIGFADEFLDALEENMVTNMSRGRLVNELNRAYHYDILPVESLAGEYTIGADGFREFHPDESSVREWIVDALYVPNN